MRARAAVWIGTLNAFGAFVAPTLANAQAAIGDAVRPFVSVDAPVVALTHARVIDGTGAAPRDAQTIIIDRGIIRALGDSPRVAIPADAKVIDVNGKSVLPGLVMVHEHMFYPSGGGSVYNEQAFSFPRLYLAGGVTTARTAGNMAGYADLELRRAIDSGRTVGPSLDVTAPYLNGPGLPIYQVHALTGPADATQMVAHWADRGATSFKAYMHIRRDELAAVVKEAHRRKLKVTGHLCSITFREAATIGIDNLEHGLVVASDFVKDKKPDECPTANGGVSASLMSLDVGGDAVRSLIAFLVAKKVALTSTLTVFETLTPGRPQAPQGALDAMLPETRDQYTRRWTQVAAVPGSAYATLFPKEMQFELAFFRAGGQLLAGTDPTGYGGVVAGYSNHRELELLVEAGLTPLEAIKVCTLSGAQYLGRANHVGSIAVGKRADLLIVNGDPSVRIADIEKVETVFKDGVGYDSAKLFASVKGQVGLH
ncbi:MAG: amidohydrolase family protein [bacterium]